MALPAEFVRSGMASDESGAPGAIARRFPDGRSVLMSFVDEDEASFLGLVVVLACNEPALERPQWWNARQQNDGQAGYKVHPEGRSVGNLDPARERGCGYASEAHDEERRTVGRIGEREIQPTVGALLFQRQEAIEDLAFAAARAQAADADFHGREGGPFMGVVGAHRVILIAVAAYAKTTSNVSLLYASSEDIARE